MSQSFIIGPGPGNIDPFPGKASAADLAALAKDVAGKADSSSLGTAATKNVGENGGVASYDDPRIEEAFQGKTPLILDSKTRTISDRLLDLARRSISAEAYGAMGGVNDTAAWDDLVAEASSIKRPIFAGAYTSAFVGPAFIKGDDVRIFSEGGTSFVEKTGTSPCFVVGDPNDPTKRPSRIGFRGLFGDIATSYVGTRANKRGSADINPFIYGGAAHYHAGIYHACGDDFTVEGVSFDNFDQPIHAIGDAWNGSAYSRRCVIRRVRLNNAMFGIFASGWDGLVLEDIEGSLIAPTTSGSDGILFPPHVVYVGFTRGGDALEVPCLNVRATNLRCLSETSGHAFKFRFVRGLIASGLLADGAPCLLNLDLVKQFDVRGLVQRNTVDDALSAVDAALQIRSCEDGLIDCGPIDGQAESTGPIHITTYDVVGYRTRSRNVRIINPTISIGHTGGSSGTRVPVLLQGTLDCSVEHAVFNHTTNVAQAPIHVQPGPQGEINEGVQIVLPRVISPAGTGTKRLVLSTDAAMTGTLIAAAGHMTNGRSVDTIIGAPSLKQVWLDDPRETILASSAVAVSTPTGTGSTVETVLATIPVPAGTLGKNGYLEVETIWSHTNSANTKTLRVRLGGAAGAAYLSQAVTATAATRDSRTIRNRNALNSQIGGTSSGTGGWGNSSVANVASAVDTSADTSVAIAGVVTAAGEVVTLESYTVRAFYQA